MRAPHLHLDASHLKRVVPTGEDATAHAAEGLVAHTQLGVRVAVPQQAHAAAHRVGEALPAGPIARLCAPVARAWVSRWHER